MRDDLRKEVYSDADHPGDELPRGYDLQCYDGPVGQCFSTTAGVRELQLSGETVDNMENSESHEIRDKLA